MKTIKNAIQFPCDAESNPFFGALATALLPALGYAEDTPFWCAPKDDYCQQCGGCGEKSALQKHHLALYHAYLTASGVAFGFDYPEDDDVPYHTLDKAPVGWRWPDAFVGDIMRLAGLSWRRFARGADDEAVYRAVSDAVDAGLPALARLGGALDWQVITGCGDGALYGLDSARHTLADGCEYTEGGLFRSARWRDTFEDVIVVTGRRDADVTLREVLDRIARTLAHPSHRRIEADITSAIDRATPENARQTAAMLNGIACVPIEARWHAAEAMCARKGVLGDLEGASALRPRLADVFFHRYIADGSDCTHSVCWRIWSLLGVRPETGCALPRDAGERLLASGAQSELRRLFTLVFDNDRAVLAALHSERDKA